MAAAKRDTAVFDPTRFDYSLMYDVACPPTLVQIQSGGWYNYWGITAASAGRNGYYGPVITGISGFSNSDYVKWLEGFYEFQLAEARKNADAIREADQILAENPQFARMLELHKKGLL